MCSMDASENYWIKKEREKKNKVVKQKYAAGDMLPWVSIKGKKKKTVVKNLKPKYSIRFFFFG